MKLSPRKLSAKFAVRTATALTGAAALTVGYAPAATANAAVPKPYKLWVYTGDSVSWIQACGWKNDSKSGHYYCTPARSNPFFANGGVHSLYMGSGWKDGEFIIKMLSFSSLTVHTCNTNGSYYGHLRSTVSSLGHVSHGVVLTHQGGTFLGMKGAAEC
jgi:hypothetical protein